VIQSEQLIAQAREWVGVKFLHQGRSRHGADCLGFISAMLAELNSLTFIQHLPGNYARMPQRLLLQKLTALCRQIPLQPGALVLFQWPLTEFPSHAGVFTGENLIHSYQTEGKVIEHGYRGPWVKRTASIWALPEVVYQ
jgi:cell wall-associated NlpC family hydrolase